MLTEGFKWIIDTVKSGSNVSFYHIYWFWRFLTDDCYTFRKDYYFRHGLPHFPWKATRFYRYGLLNPVSVSVCSECVMLTSLFQNHDRSLWLVYD